MVAVPDLADLPPSEAFDALRSVGLRPVLLGLPTAKSDGNLGFYVAAQEPTAGVEVEAGSRVTLACDVHPLSWGTLAGPPVAPLGTPAPDVLGVQLETAMHLVTREGLIAVVFQPRHAVEQITILRQEPTPGTPVERFREVALWLD